MLHRWFSLLTLTLTLTFLAAAQADFDASRGSADAPFANHTGVLGHQTQVVSGSVHSFEGQPVKDAEIELRSVSSASNAMTTYTNAAGHFEFSQVPGGSYTIVAQSALASVSQQVALDGGDPNLTLRLPQQYSSDAGNANSVSVAQMRVPEEARKLLRKAEEAASKQKLDEAQKHVDHALQIYPHYAGALTLQGILKLDSHNYDAARQDIEQAIQYDSSYPLAYIALGTTYNMLSRWYDAVQTLNHGIGLDPSSWQGYFELGKSYIGKADYNSALKNLGLAQDLAPKYSLVHLLKAHALLGLKDYADAMGELEVYLQREPNGAQSAQERETLGKVKAFVATNNK